MKFLLLLSLLIASTFAAKEKEEDLASSSLIDILSNKNHVAEKLTKQALSNLVEQADYVLGNLTDVRNKSKDFYERIKEIDDKLKSNKPLGIVPTSDQNTIFNEQFHDLLKNEQEEQKVKNKFSIFVDNLKEFEKVFNERKGLEDTLSTLAKNTLLSSDAKKVQNDMGVSDSFFDEVLSLFKEKGSAHTIIDKLTNPCKSTDCNGFNQGLDNFRKLVKLASAPTLSDLVHNATLLSEDKHAFQIINNSTTFNFTSIDSESETPSLFDKIVSFFKETVQKPDHSKGPAIPIDKVQSVSDFFNLLFQGHSDGKLKAGDEDTTDYGNKYHKP